MNEFSQTILYLIAQKGENQQIKAFNAASCFCAVKLRLSEIPRHPLLLLTHSQQLSCLQLHLFPSNHAQRDTRDWQGATGLAVQQQLLSSNQL